MTMLKGIRRIFWWLLVLVVVVVGAVALLVQTVDPNEYKPRIEKLVADKTGRDIDLEGELQMTVFPWVGVETGRVRLANAEGFGDEPMLEVANARIKVKLLPLIKRKLEVDTVVLDTPVIRLATDPQGVNNWDDLVGGASSGNQQDNPAGGLAVLVVEGISIDDGTVRWQNRQTDQSLAINNLNLETGRLVPGEPLDISLSLDGEGSMLPEPASIALETTVTVNEELDNIALDGTSFDLDAESISATAGIGGFTYALASQQMSAREVDATLTRDGKESRIEFADLSADLANFAVDLPGAVVTSGNDRIELNFQGQDLAGAGRSMDGDFTFSIADLNVLLGEFGMQELLADYPDTQLTNLKGSGGFQMAGEQLNSQDIDLQAEVNGLPTSIKSPSLDYNLESEALALPELSVSQTDFAVKLSANGKGIVSGEDNRSANGNLDLQVASVSELLGRNGIDMSMPEILVENINLQTNFALQKNNVTASRLDAGFDYNGQATGLVTNNAAFDIGSGTLLLEGLNLVQGDSSVALDGKASNLLGEFDLKRVGASGKWKVNAANLPDLLARNGIEAEIPNGVATSVSAESEISLENDNLSLNGLKVQIDDTSISGSLGAQNLDNPAYRFDLVVDQLDLDQLDGDPQSPAPAEGTVDESQAAVQGDTAQAGAQGSQAAATERVALSSEPLQGLNADGRLQVGRLVTSGITLTDVDATLKAANDVLMLEPLKANLFGGSLDSTIQYDVSDTVPAIHIQNKTSNVKVGELLSALKITDRIEGTGNLNADLRGQGANTDTLMASMSGDIGTRMQDGAIKGYDLQKALLAIESQINAFQGKESTTTVEHGAKTRFAEFSATFKAENGVFRNNDLDMKAPLFRINGGGEIGLPNNRIDYKLDVNVVGSVEGQGGAALEELEGQRIPLKIYGPLNEPSITLDLASLAKEEVKKELKEQLLKELDIAPAGQEGEAADSGQAVDDPEESLEDKLKKEVGKELLKGLGF